MIPIVEKNQFPTYLYHGQEGPRLFENEEEYNNLKHREEWFDSPIEACFFYYTKICIDWSPNEAACLLNNFDPKDLKHTGHEGIEKINNLENLIKKSMRAKKLKSHNGLIVNYECIKWAKSQKINIPKKLEANVQKCMGIFNMPLIKKSVIYSILIIMAMAILIFPPILNVFLHYIWHNKHIIMQKIIRICHYKITIISIIFPILALLSFYFCPNKYTFVQKIIRICRFQAEPKV